MKQTLAVISACILAGAALQPAPAAAPVVTIEERYITPLEPEANIDSVAVAPGAPALLFATAKATDVIKVFDASNGVELRELGGSGASSEQLLRPNGVAVADDLLVIVERDNRRVNIRSIPDYRALATFGEEQLRNPYGLWVQTLGDNEYRIYVTDAYEMPDEGIPPNAELDERVKSFRIGVERDDSGKPSGVQSRFERSFGDTTSPGALRVVESIFGDPEHDAC